MRLKRCRTQARAVELQSPDPRILRLNLSFAKISGHRYVANHTE